MVTEKMDKFERLLRDSKLSLANTVDFCEKLYDSNECTCSEDPSTPICFTCQLGNLLTMTNINLTEEILLLMKEVDNG